jgi:hypothetical protein
MQSYKPTILAQESRTDRSSGVSWRPKQPVAFMSSKVWGFRMLIP